MNKINISLGIVTGVIVAMIMLTPLATVDFSKLDQVSAGYLERFLASVGGVVAMILAYRQSSEFKFGQIIKTGVLTCAITATTLFVLMVVYFKAINPEYITNHLNALTLQRVATITDEAKKAQEIASIEKNMATYTNPYIYSLSTVLPTFLVSLMPVAICGYILFRIYRVKKAMKK